MGTKENGQPVSSEANHASTPLCRVSGPRGLGPRDDNRLRVSPAASRRERPTRTAAPSRTKPTITGTATTAPASRETSRKPSPATSFAFMGTSVHCLGARATYHEGQSPGNEGPLRARRVGLSESGGGARPCGRWPGAFGDGGRRALTEPAQERRDEERHERSELRRWSLKFEGEALLKPAVPEATDHLLGTHHADHDGPVAGQALYHDVTRLRHSTSLGSVFLCHRVPWRKCRRP